VFAGEEIQTVITFKNVASISDNTPEAKNCNHKGWTASGSAAESGGSSSQTPRLAAINNHGARTTSKSGHRTTTSLSIPFTRSSVPRSTSWTASPITRSRPPHNHKRSVSIISMGSPDVGNEETQRAMVPPRSRPAMKHNRSASLQVQPRRNDVNCDGPSSCEHRTFTF